MFSTAQFPKENPKELTSTMPHWKIRTSFCPLAYRFGTYAILRKHTEIFLCQKFINQYCWFQKKRQGTFAKCLFLQLLGILTLTGSTHTNPSCLVTELPEEPLGWADPHQFRHQFAKRIYEDLLNFKGQICKQVFPVNWWLVCCHSYPSGYHQFVFPMRRPGRETAEVPQEFITFRFSLHCTGTLGDF